MKLIFGLTGFPDELRRGAVTVGNFDGVHLGHARIVGRLIAKARQLGQAAVVLTFDPHPVRLLRPTEAPPPLTWTNRKAELLGALGVDVMVVYPTNHVLLNLTAQEFFDQIIRETLDAQAMVEGPNFFFGRDRAGDIELLRRLTGSTGMSLDVVEPVEIDGQYVSSSLVRKLVTEGWVREAGRMLTRPYRIRGMVTHGVRRGAKIGFPTANIEAIDTLLPGQGVYAGRGLLKDDGTDREKSYPAAVNVGPNPTFGENAMKVEAHLIGFEGPLYGRTLEIDFIGRLRDIHTFNDVDALKSQLARDVEAAKELVESSE